LSDKVTAATYNEGAVYNIQITNLSRNRVTIQYDIISEPAYITIYLYDSKYNSTEHVFSAITTDTIYTFINITPEITYNLHIVSTYTHTGYDDNSYSILVPNAFTTAT
jgi:hypothetical protein